MKKTDYNDWKDTELEKEVITKQEALRVFRFNESGSRTRNVREGRNLRREIAKILTELVTRSVASRKKTKKYLVHDPGNTAAVGDKVIIRETKPISKRKNFMLVERISLKLEARS